MADVSFLEGKKHPRIKVQILLGQCPVFYSVVSSLPSQRARRSSVWWRHTRAHHRWPSRWAETSAFHVTGFIWRLKGKFGSEKVCFPCQHSQHVGSNIWDWIYWRTPLKTFLRSLFSFDTSPASGHSWKWFCRCRPGPVCGASCNLQFNQLWGFYSSKVFWSFGRLLRFVPVLLISLAVQPENSMNPWCGKIPPTSTNQGRCSESSERCIAAPADMRDCDPVIQWSAALVTRVTSCATTLLSSAVLIQSAFTPLVFSTLSKSSDFASILYCFTVL